MLRESPIGKVKGVLFDKDGTLSNSESHLLKLAQSRIQVASQLLNEQGASGNEVQQLEELLSKAYGLTNAGISPNGIIAIGSRSNNLISTATVICLLGKTWPQGLELSSQIFKFADALAGRQNGKEKQRSLLPGVREALQRLREADVTCALISNDSQVGIQSFLSSNNIQSFFSNLWSADHLPPKPHPSAVKGLCKKLNLHPSECALVGDADSDLLMARQSGIGVTLGYTAGWTTKPQLTEYQYLINNWDELSISQNKH